MLLEGWVDEGYGLHQLGSFLDKELPEPPPLVANVIPRGTITVIAGQHKVGKTFITSQLGLTVAAGAPWLGFETAPTRVLYLNYEVAPWSYQRRIKKQIKGLVAQGLVTAQEAEAIRQNLYVQSLPDWRISNRSDLQLMGEKARELGLGLIVVDPIRGAMKGDRNKDEVVDRIMQDILDLIVKPSGAAVVLAHHMRKPPSGEAITGSTWDIKGSGGFSDAADNIITIWRDKKEARLVHMGFTLRHYEGIDDYQVQFMPASALFKQLQQAPTPPQETGEVSAHDLI